MADTPATKTPRSRTTTRRATTRKPSEVSKATPKVQAEADALVAEALGTDAETLRPESSGSSSGSKRAKVKATASKAADSVKAEAATLKGKAADAARSAADTGKAKAAGAAAGLGKLVDESAGAIDKNFGESYGDYARSAAKAIEGFADTLDSKQVDELLEDARSYVKKSPAVAIGAAAVVGFVVARLLKSGADGRSDDKA